jgi:hypothetical protein
MIGTTPRRSKVGQVGVRQQHLGGAQAVGAKARLVHLRQAHLADRGAGLQFMDIGGTARKTEAQHAFGDRPRAHQHDFLAERAQAGDLQRPARDGG